METYTLGYKFRIYPNRTQENLINRTLGCARFVFNHFLAVRRDEWKANHNSLTYVKTSKLLTDLKKREETAWLSGSGQHGIRRNPCGILTARFRTSFAKRARYPRFKSKHSHSQSYRTRNQTNGIHIIDKRIKLPKIGLVRIKQSRDFDGRILSATVKSGLHSGNTRFALCRSRKRILAAQSNGKRIGIDVGLKVFYSEANGDTVENPHPLKKLQRKLRREQRWLSRKMPKSVNRKRARVRVARVHERIANIRSFLH